MFPLYLGLLGPLGEARAADTRVVRACTEPASPDVAWAIARTVHIETDSGSGTGAVVSPDGFVLTAAHVVGETDTVSVVFAGGETLEGKVEVRNSREDLALVSFDPPDDVACFPLKSTPALVGSDVLVVGSPGGQQLSHSVAKGIVSAYREMHETTVVQTDASINSGNSGGPLVGDDGELIGIVSYKVVGDGVEGLGFAVAATAVPSALGLRWGTHTQDADTQTLTDLAPRDTPDPRIEWASTRSFEPQQRYHMARRPHSGNLAWGITLGALGGVMAAMSASTANEFETMPEARWQGLTTLNDIGFVSAGLGAGLVGLSFVVPSKHAPIEEVKP